MSWLSRDRLPEHLTTFRLLLGPVLLASSFFGEHPRFFLFALLAGLLSDIFDGILARRFGVATDALRAYDSRADLVFWLCVLATTWVVRPAEVAEHAGPITAVLGAEGASHATSLLHFGRMASAHALLSKAYGVAVFWSHRRLASNRGQLGHRRQRRLRADSAAAFVAARHPKLLACMARAARSAHPTQPAVPRLTVIVAQHGSLHLLRDPRTANAGVRAAHCYAYVLHAGRHV